MTTCAIYIRKSREDKEREAHRLTIQRQQLPAHALAQGWAVETYDDGFASAARGKIADLSQRARLEADINAGKIDIILCLELSRLSRDDSLQDYVAWLHLCGQHRVKLATPSRILDPGQNSDWMLLLMEGGFSSVEMRTLTARMTEGREQARSVGKFLGGAVPWPYLHSRELKQPVIDPEQLPRFRRAIEMLQEYSIVHINRVLDLPRARLNRVFQEERLLFYLAQRVIDDQTITCGWPPVITPEWEDLILTPEDWPLLTHNEQREYIVSIVDHLTMTHDDIAITYRFPLDISGRTTETIRLPGRRARKPVKNRS